jgi:hypothetical protein
MEQRQEGQSYLIIATLGATVVLAVGMGAYLVLDNTLLAFLAALAGLAVFGALVSTEMGLYATIAVACFDGFVKGFAPNMLTMVLKDVFLGITLLRWAWDGLNRQPRASLGHPVALPAFLFVAYCAAQMFNSESMSWLLALAGLRSWVIWIPVFFIAYDTCRTRRQFERMVMFIAVISAVTGMYTVVQHQIGFEHLYRASHNFSYYKDFRQGATVRAPGSYVNPGTAGSALSFAATVCLGVALASPAFSLRQLLLLACAPVCWVGMAATGSRAPLVGAVIALGAFVLLTRRPQLAIAMVLMGVLALGQTNRYAGNLTATRYSASHLNPSGIWARAVGPFTTGLELLGQYPLGTGVAAGTGAGRATFMVDEPLVVKHDAAVMIENELGRAMKELGLPGIWLLLWLLWRAIGSGLRGWRQSTGRDSWLASGLLAGALNLSVQLMVGSALYLAPGGIYFWIACALAARVPDYEAQDRAALEQRTPEQEAAWTALAARTQRIHVRS